MLLTLLYQCSPPPPAANPSATSGWKVSTGWGGGTSLNRWYGVSTRHEDVTMVGSERVTGLMLGANSLCGEEGGVSLCVGDVGGWFLGWVTVFVSVGCLSAALVRGATLSVSLLSPLL